MLKKNNMDFLKKAKNNAEKYRHVMYRKACLTTVDDRISEHVHDIRAHLEVQHVSYGKLGSELLFL